jgi:nitroimidazol reductase NimA-like FMN-containing flavoprotein (pyridoxamine 5'-phosphate oxidase superfamily)
MRELADDAIVSVLSDNGIGVLALAGGEGTVPYPIPVAYGYDPDRDLLALHLHGDGENEKHRRLARDEGVGFVVYEETEPRTVWRSVLVEGRLVETSYEAAEPALARLTQNAGFAPNPLHWGDPDSIRPHELRVESWSGREFRLG